MVDLLTGAVQYVPGPRSGPGERVEAWHVLSAPKFAHSARGITQRVNDGLGRLGTRVVCACDPGRDFVFLEQSFY